MYISQTHLVKAKSCRKDNHTKKHIHNDSILYAIRCEHLLENGWKLSDLYIVVWAGAAHTPGP